jgi:hypothetical protein
MIRHLIFIAALAGGATTSQFPEFSQHYLQRLAGQYDALQQVTQEFDASAVASGLTREGALQELSGSEFREAHRTDMETAFARLSRIESDLTLLRAAGPLERIVLPHRFRDAKTLQATWDDFAPAIPLTLAGLYAGGIGFLASWVLLSVVMGAFLRPFRRRTPEYEQA